MRVSRTLQSSKPQAWRAAVLLCALTFACVATGNAQTFALTPSVSTASTITTPVLADYTAGTSATTATWSMAVTCPNSIGNASNYCVYQARLSSVALTALGSIRVRFTIAGGDCRSTPGSFDITLTTTTAVDLFEVKRNNGLSNCTVTNLRFTVTDLSLTKYKSSTSANTFASNAILFGSVVR